MIKKVPASSSEFLIRRASLKDLDQLDELEYDAVDDEPFSRQQLRHLLSKANALTLVLEATQVPVLLSDSCEEGSADSERRSSSHNEQTLFGYGLLLFRKNSHYSRLYSLALHPDIRHQGYGSQLLDELEKASINRGRANMILEVRADNRAALRLYRAKGYMAMRWIDDFYSDGCAAYRMSKSLISA